MTKENKGLFSQQVVRDLGLYKDNFYTSVNLAKELLKYKTHLVGTLRNKRKHNSKPATTAKLQKGNFKMLQRDSKIIVDKWKDKREVL